MNKKRRDHFVQQLLIRQFLNENGRVFCLDKEQQRIPDRVHGNRPKDILYRRGYYSDQLGDLDQELYKPIENNFARHLQALVKDARAAITVPGATVALQEWVAAQLTRTQETEVFLRLYAKRFNRPDFLKRMERNDGIINEYRYFFYQMELRAMRECSWRAYWADEDERTQFVLGDEPAIKTPPAWATGSMYIVPLSPTLIVAGGTERGHKALKDPDRNILPGGINGLQMSYAQRFVYAKRLLELDSLASMFSIKGDPEHDAWMAHAAHPHFGLERMFEEATDEEIEEFRRSREGEGQT